MISSGYFKVTENTLRRLGKKQGMTFIREMFCCGGRIGYYEFIEWETWINENLKPETYLGNFEQDTGGRVDVYVDDDGLLTI